MQPTDSKIDSIMSQFPGPVRLYPSRKKWLLILLISALFTAIGAWMVAEKADAGWAGLIFFATCLLVSALMLLPGAGGLVLDADGFQATNLFRRYRLHWQNVEGFEAVAIPGARQRLVGYDDVSIGRVIGAINKELSGRNAALPDTYGFSADALAELMRRWRERAMAG